jgi:hypothetical protein
VYLQPKGFSILFHALCIQNFASIMDSDLLQPSRCQEYPEQLSMDFVRAQAVDATLLEANSRYQQTLVLAIREYSLA